MGDRGLDGSGSQNSNIILLSLILERKIKQI